MGPQGNAGQPDKMIIGRLSDQVRSRLAGTEQGSVEMDFRPESDGGSRGRVLADSFWDGLVAGADCLHQYCRHPARACSGRVLLSANGEDVCRCCLKGRW